MFFPKFLSAAAGLALTSTLAFGWSISGVVNTTEGAPLQGVSVTSFNYASKSTVTDELGRFSLSELSDGLSTLQNSKTQMHFNNHILNIDNLDANIVKISMIDVLGKVIYQQTFKNIAGRISVDLSKYSTRGEKFFRISLDENSNSYRISTNGALLKIGGPLPSFMFFKEGYQNADYTMQAMDETDVIIVMQPSNNNDNPIKSSSSTFNPFERLSSVIKPAESSSSIVTPPTSSSSREELIVNCAGKTHQAGDHKMSVNVDGKNRTFIMHVPSQYKGDKAVPLVVDYHPIGGSGDGQLNSSPYKGKTDPEGVITLYPDGTDGKSMMGAGWNVGPCCSYDDDVKFSREMIKKVEETVCIDPKRVYATGFSMGGGMSNHVACNMSDIYAAVAPAAMDLNVDNSAKCNPTRPISVIMFRGTNDFVCRYDGGDSGFNDGLNFLGAEKNFKFWADKNGCTGSPSKNSNGCDEYSNCKDGTKVVLCTKQGGGHDYGDANVGWPFLKSFTMP